MKSPKSIYSYWTTKNDENIADEKYTEKICRQKTKYFHWGMGDKRHKKNYANCKLLYYKLLKKSFAIQVWFIIYHFIFCFQH